MFPIQELFYAGAQSPMSSGPAQPEEPSGETGIPCKAGPKHRSERPSVGEGRLVMPSPDSRDRSGGSSAVFRAPAGHPHTARRRYGRHLHPGARQRATLAIARRPRREHEPVRLGHAGSPAIDGFVFNWRRRNFAIGRSPNLQLADVESGLLSPVRRESACRNARGFAGRVDSRPASVRQDNARPDCGISRK